MVMRRTADAVLFCLYTTSLWYTLREEKEVEMNKQVFDPYKLNNKIELRNRFVMAPMTTWSGNDNGSVSEEELDYYKYRSHGVGLVITATTYVQASGKGFSGQFYAGSDEMLPSLKSLAEVIHSGGAKAILQVFHAGRKGNPKDLPEGQTVSASAVAGKREEDNIPRALKENEILDTIESFKQSVIRADKAGFDGIEIHGANTYLLQQFFSPHSNIRTDLYGGSLEKRSNFSKAIIDACISAKSHITNKDFIIGYRLSPEENSDPGITLSDSDYLLDVLCETDIDYIHISLSEYNQKSIRDDSDELVMDRFVNKINKRKPFIGVGSVYTLDDANDMMSYDVDLVAVGRQLLIDGKSIEKWANGELSKTVYSEDHQVEEHIPRDLHDVILRNKGWVPQ